MSQVTRLLTAECRFWWEGHAPPDIVAWFDALGPEPFETRTDHYAVLASETTGVKQRGGTNLIEIKSLIDETVDNGADTPPCRLWIKTSLEQLQWANSDHVAIEKRRRIVKFRLANGLPERCDESSQPDCEIELSDVKIGAHGPWTSLCFEAPGDMSSARARLATTFTALEPPGLPGKARLASYPEWLREIYPRISGA